MKFYSFYDSPYLGIAPLPAHSQGGALRSVYGVGSGALLSSGLSSFTKLEGVLCR